MRDVHPWKALGAIDVTLLVNITLGLQQLTAPIVEHANYNDDNNILIIILII